MKRILVGEDQDNIYNLIIKPNFERFFELIRGKNGNDTMKLYSELSDSLDGIILDYNMPPGMDGINCARIIRQSDKDIPIALFTNKDMEHECPPINIRFFFKSKGPYGLVDYFKNELL